MLWNTLYSMDSLAMRKLTCALKKDWANESTSSEEQKTSVDFWNIHKLIRFWVVHFLLLVRQHQINQLKFIRFYNGRILGAYALVRTTPCIYNYIFHVTFSPSRSLYQTFASLKRIKAVCLFRRRIRNVFSLSPDNIVVVVVLGHICHERRSIRTFCHGIANPNC